MLSDAESNALEGIGFKSFNKFLFAYGLKPNNEENMRKGRAILSDYAQQISMLNDRLMNLLTRDAERKEGRAKAPGEVGRGSDELEIEQNESPLANVPHVNGFDNNENMANACWSKSEDFEDGDKLMEALGRDPGKDVEDETSDSSCTLSESDGFPGVDIMIKGTGFKNREDVLDAYGLKPWESDDMRSGTDNLGVLAEKSRKITGIESDGELGAGPRIDTVVSTYIGEALKEAGFTFNFYAFLNAHKLKSYEQEDLDKGMAILRAEVGSKAEGHEEEGAWTGIDKAIEEAGYESFDDFLFNLGLQQGDVKEGMAILRIITCARKRNELRKDIESDEVDFEGCFARKRLRMS